MFDVAELRDRERVFRDRAEAGSRVAALLLEHEQPRHAVVLALPVGGVPVAAPVAAALAAELDVAVASKITLPSNTEVGYGAVAFDGSAFVDDDLVRRFGLSAEEVGRGVAATRAKVERRLSTLRAGRSPLALSGRTVVVVDDGVASGSTLKAVLAPLRLFLPARLVVALPTGSSRTARRLDGEVDALYIANVRSGSSFAVASAYAEWHDVDEDEALALLARSAPPEGSAGP